MSNHLRATAWLGWTPPFLLGQYVRKLPWPKCFPSKSLSGTAFWAPSKTGSLPVTLLPCLPDHRAHLVGTSARDGGSSLQA